MADPDPIEAGLEKTRLELEELAARLAPLETAPEAPTNPLDSDDAKEAGLVVAEMIGASLRSLLFDRPPKPRTPRRPWRFTSPAQQAVAAPPLRPAATAPQLVPGVQQAPAPVESGRPNTVIPGQPGHGLDFVGHLDDRPRADASNRFPKEFLEAHERRIDIDRTEPLSRPPLRGPIIGGSQ